MINVRATPGARTNSVTSIDGDALRIKVAAPPVEGKANEALCRFIAELLGIRVSAVEVIRGSTARMKLVSVEGCTPADAGTALTRRTTYIP